ncbi:MAG: DNA cytosine methyltransferase [Waltera sp.]
MAREGDGINLAYPDSETRRGKGRKRMLPDIGLFRADGNAHEGGCIRRLTPRECFRLQGFSDELFDRASAVNSDAQLYKQAGNAVTATVAYAVAMSLPESRS